MSAVELKTENFQEALNDYLLLLNRGYPEKQSLKLVGNHHRLTGNQRLCLYRGITSRSRAGNRRKKLTEELTDQAIHIDGYNVLFTIMNHLLGKTLFIGNDGFVRDCGAVYGKIAEEQKFVRAVRLLLGTLAKIRPRETTLYMDNTIENCHHHLRIIEGEWTPHGKPLNPLLVKHADTRLKGILNGIVATSDSEIIDAVNGKMADLARLVLSESFEVSPFDLNRLVK